MSLTEQQHDQGWVSWKSPGNPFTDVSYLIKKDTGAGGSCQFSSIAECLYPVKKISTAAVRAAAAQGVLSMNRTDFDVAMQVYRTEKAEGSFCGGWDPDQVSSVRELANQILLANLSGNGGYFWGDQVTLVAIAKHFDLDIYVMEKGDQEEPLIIKNTHCDGKSAGHAIFLWFYRRGLHYQSVGVQLRHGKQTIFLPQEIPSGLWKYIQRGESPPRQTPPRQTQKRLAMPSMPPMASPMLIQPPLRRAPKRRTIQPPTTTVWPLRNINSIVGNFCSAF
jgi:hypothetical protein